jgi:ribosomal protein S20
MPIIKSAIKRAKQTIKRRARNVGIKHDIKEATKAFVAKPSAATLSAAHSELDIAIKKGLLKKNTVARRKAQLSKIAKDAGVKLATGTKKVVAKTAVKKTPVKAAVAKKPAVKAAAAKKTPTVAKKVAVKKPAAKKVTK